jgi:hypothetical protein
MHLFREVAFTLKITVFWDVMLLDCRQLPFKEGTATFNYRLMLVTNYWIMRHYIWVPFFWNWRTLRV